MDTETILNQALSMPEVARAELAEKLLASLGEPNDSELEELWLRESEGRAAEIDQGKVSLISADEASKQVKELIG